MQILAIITTILSIPHIAGIISIIVLVRQLYLLLVYFLFVYITSVSIFIAAVFSGLSSLVEATRGVYHFLLRSGPSLP